MYLLIFLLFLCPTLAFATAPVADFTCTPTTGTIPLTITCTDASTNTPTSWAWNFGTAYNANSVTTSGTTTGASSTSITDTGKDFVALSVATGDIVRDNTRKCLCVITSVATTTLTCSAGFVGCSATPTTGDAYEVGASLVDNQLQNPTYTYSIVCSPNDSPNNACYAYTVSLKACNNSGADCDVKVRTVYITPTAPTLSSFPWVVNPAYPSGLWAMPKQDVDASTSPDTYANPAVAGVMKRCKWSTIQPTATTYDWSCFDDEVTRARAAGKQLVLVIVRGSSATALPSWVPGSRMTCTSQGNSTGPIPWDTSYQVTWISTWRALIARYESEPVVVGYGLNGIYSWKTVDMDLCDGTQSMRDAWITAGYTEAKIRLWLDTFMAALRPLSSKPFIGFTSQMLCNDGQNRKRCGVQNYLMPQVTSGNRSRVSRTVAAHTVLASRTAITDTRFHAFFHQTMIGSAGVSGARPDTLQAWNMPWDFQVVKDTSNGREDDIETSPGGYDGWFQKYPGQVWMEQGPGNYGTYIQRGDLMLHLGVNMFKVNEQTINDNPTDSTCINTALLANPRGHCGH